MAKQPSSSSSSNASDEDIAKQSIIEESLGIDLDDESDDESDDEEQDDDEEESAHDDADDAHDDGEDDRRVSHTKQPQEKKGKFKDVSLKGKDKQFPQRAEVKPDARGNLVDAQGNIVARAGKEARLYQDAHKAKSELARFQQAAQARFEDMTSKLERAVEIGRELNTKYQALREAGTVAERAGLNNDEHMQAVEMARIAKTQGPVAALKMILTRAAAAGIDLTQLGLQPGAVDPRSLNELIRTEISTALNPLKERSEQEKKAQEQQQQQRRELEQSQRVVRTFFSENPEARPYLPVFEQVLSEPRFANMTLGEVWARIQLNLLKRQRENGGRRSTRERPSGRASIPVARGSEDGDEAMAPVSMSFDDIIKDVLNKHHR
jgi:hypothetical protein